MMPLWMKLAYTAFVCVLIPTYWVEYGPQNFLWGSDIALFAVLLAVWLEHRLLAGMTAVAILLPELVWIIDFVLRLIFGPSAVPANGTQYMFDSETSLLVRGLSMFHLVLPLLLVWLLYRFGYDRRAFLYQTLVAWIILPLTYVLTEPSRNINWVHGFGPEPQAWMPGYLFVGLLMVVFPLGVYLPTHLLLGKLFARARL